LTDEQGRAQAELVPPSRSDFNTVKPLVRVLPLIAAIALLAGCGSTGPPRLGHAEAVQLAQYEVDDWMGQNLNTGYGGGGPICARRLTASSFQCQDQIYYATDVKHAFKYAYFLMTVDIGPAAGAYPGATYLACSNTTKVIQQYPRSGGPTLWLPVGTSSGKYTGRVRHFREDRCP
jgi:hypothetical protein